MKKGASLRPSEFKEGGGLLDNADVLWKGLEFTMFDFNSGTDVPVLQITMEDLEKDGGDDIVQYFSVGNKDLWEPSGDGKSLEYIGPERTDKNGEVIVPSLNKGSNMGILLNSLVEAGFPEDQLDDDITALEGLKCHMVRVPAPKRRNTSNFQKQEGKEQTNLIVESIIELPGGKKSGKPTTKTSAPKNTAAPKGTKSAPAEEAPAGDVGDAATDIVMEILGKDGNEKGLTKQKLASAVFAAAKEHPERAAISKLVFTDEFLNNGPWTYDAKKSLVSL